MGKRYKMQAKDTFAKLAKKNYDDSRFAEPLASYNGIRDTRTIVRGEVIELPSKRELLAPRALEKALLLAPPHGLEQILATFGDIYKYIRADGTLDPKWEVDQLATAPLPFPITLDWDPTQQATRIRCHKKLAGIFEDVFKAIQAKGLREKVKTYAGCYNFRPKRAGSKLSTHSWGIAIDLNAKTNPMGSPGDMDLRVVQVFRSFGFKWGGDWTGNYKDPMHFQFCTGY